MKDVTELQIPLLVKDLVKRGIVKTEVHAKFECYWTRNISLLLNMHGETIPIAGGEDNGRKLYMPFM